MNFPVSATIQTYLSQQATGIILPSACRKYFFSITYLYSTFIKNNICSIVCCDKFISGILSIRRDIFVVEQFKPLSRAL